MIKKTDPPKILIVEDERSIADLMKIMLLRCGYCVNGVVASVKEAVEIAIHTRPDLILMDIKLSGEMDGIIAYEQIKKSVDIPAVFVSAFTDEDIIARAQQTNPSGYIVKPFKIEQLITGVEKALAGRKSSEDREV